MTGSRACASTPTRSRPSRRSPARRSAHEDLVLQSPDGNRFAAFAAVPEDHIGTGVIVLPDVRGLYRFYEELALRFAERGVAPSRSTTSAAPPASTKREDDLDYMPHVAQTTLQDIQADVGAARARLRTPTGGCARRLHGRLLLRRPQLLARGGRAATGSPARSASTACRAGATASRARSSAPRDDGADPRPEGRRRPGHHGGRQRGLRGGARGGRRRARVRRLRGAPHSFFDRKYEEFAEASEDAWLRTLAFIAHHGGQDPR